MSSRKLKKKVERFHRSYAIASESLEGIDIVMRVELAYISGYEAGQRAERAKQKAKQPMDHFDKQYRK